MDALKFVDKEGNVEITITTRSIQNSLRRLKSRVGEDAAMHYCDYRSSAEGTLQWLVCRLFQRARSGRHCPL